jgi:hypothetical protein
MPDMICEAFPLARPDHTLLKRNLLTWHAA